jgi:hypothetical protein
MALEVRLNDLPVFHHAGGGRTRNALINPWIVDGRNTVLVRIALPAGLDAPPTGAYVDVTITVGDATVYTFNWKPTVPLAILPLTAGGEFISETRFGLWSWQRGERIRLTPETLSAINAHVQRIFHALSSANLEQAMELFRMKAVEQATAFGMPLEERLAQQRRFFREMFSQPTWRMEPVDYVHLDYRLYAEGRVVSVKNWDGSDILRSAPDSDGAVFSVPLLLSLVDRKWTVVR